MKIVVKGASALQPNCIIRFRYQGKSGRLQKRVRYGKITGRGINLSGQEYITVEHIRARKHTNQYRSYRLDRMGTDRLGKVKAAVEIL